MKHIIVIILSIAVWFTMVFLYSASDYLYRNYIGEIDYDLSFGIGVYFYYGVTLPIVILMTNVCYVFVEKRKKRWTAISSMYFIFTILFWSLALDSRPYRTSLIVAISTFMYIINLLTIKKLIKIEAISDRDTKSSISNKKIVNIYI